MYYIKKSYVKYYTWIYICYNKGEKMVLYEDLSNVEPASKLQEKSHEDTTLRKIGL